MKFPIFDVGLEFEFFITKKNHVYNAKKVLHDALGFSIDQNEWHSGSLKMGKGFQLRTDGTCVELQWFSPYNFGSLPSDIWTPINEMGILAPFTRCCEPYLKQGDTLPLFGTKKVDFVDPNNVFRSEKTMINAYTGRSRPSEKKDVVRAVTERTAGVHLHFSINPRSCGSLGAYDDDRELNRMNAAIFGSDHTHTNELVKRLDRIYDHIFVNSHCGPRFSEASKKRLQRYHTRGEYRIKQGTRDSYQTGTETGYPTLEYRQLDSSMMSIHRIQQLIDAFQTYAASYFKECEL